MFGKPKEEIQKESGSNWLGRLDDLSAYLSTDVEANPVRQAGHYDERLKKGYAPWKRCICYTRASK